MNAKSRRILPALTSVVLLAAIAVQAQAQTVTYDFTGTRVPDASSGGIGDTITGSLTLDIGADPDHVQPDGSGDQSARWSDGNFSIDGMTDTEFIEGTSVFGEDGVTSFYSFDFPSVPRQGAHIESLQLSDNLFAGIAFRSYSFTVGDGTASLPNRWDPLAHQVCFIEIWHLDFERSTLEAGMFSVDSFALAVSDTIIIDGCDTGIQDFTYEEELVSEHLADCAADAKNHGAYVRAVAQLANELKKAGLLTGKQKGTIVSCAAASSIGK